MAKSFFILRKTANLILIINSLQILSKKEKKTLFMQGKKTCWFLFVKTIGDGSGGWLVDNTQHVQTRDHTSILNFIVAALLHYINVSKSKRHINGYRIYVENEASI